MASFLTKFYVSTILVMFAFISGGAVALLNYLEPGILVCICEYNILVCVFVCMFCVLSVCFACYRRGNQWLELCTGVVFRRKFI